MSTIRFATFGTATLAALLAPMLAVAVVGSAEAATSGTIKLSGTVATACTVAVTDASQSLDITDGETNKTVGTVVENCNSGTGYTISISSANSGSLKSTSNGASPISYQVSYDGSTSALSSALQVTRSSAQFAKSVSVGVTVPANSTAVAGSYSDTLTISIAAK